MFQMLVAVSVCEGFTLRFESYLSKLQSPYAPCVVCRQNFASGFYDLIEDARKNWEVNVSALDVRQFYSYPNEPPM